MTSEPAVKYKKQFNITAKKIFRTWLLEAIKDDDFESFKECVRCIGTEWHVARTVEKDLKESFAKHLWDERKNIQDGTYTGWTESDYDAYSYESKICFVINPVHYKLIYDGNNRDALKKKTGKFFEPTEWQSAVDSFFKTNYADITDIDKIFEIDFDLWSA